MGYLEKLRQLCKHTSMAKKQETVFKEKMFEDLRVIPYCWACKIQQVTKRGTPDFLICIRGHFVAIELKKDEHESADPLQQFNLDKIKRCQGMAFTVSPKNWPEVLQLLNSLALSEPNQL